MNIHGLNTWTVAPTLSRSNKAKATSHVQHGVSGVFIEQNRLLFDDKLHPEAIRFNQVAVLKIKVPENAGSGPVCVIIDGQSVQGQLFTYEYASPESPLAVSGNKDPFLSLCILPFHLPDFQDLCHHLSRKKTSHIKPRLLVFSYI